jgi:hypothetical protein
VQKDAVAGAVYSPFELMVPQLADHVTAVFVLPVTVEVNCSVVPALTESEVGLMVTTTGSGGGAVTITLAEAESAGFTTLVAVTAQEVVIAGAVYKPLELMLPQDADQVTEVFVLPVTVEANCSVASASMESDSGLIATTTVGGGVPDMNAIANACAQDELSACTQLNAISEVEEKKKCCQASPLFMRLPSVSPVNGVLSKTNPVPTLVTGPSPLFSAAKTIPG